MLYEKSVNISLLELFLIKRIAVNDHALHLVELDDEDIINAIRYHTTGRAGMSVLEKVIFLADFTSAERDYEDVDVIRAKTELSLEDGMLYGVEFTLKKLLSIGGLLSVDAIDLYNEILLNR